MARRAQGQVVKREWKGGTGYALRFLAYGERQYLTLGLLSDGWDDERAELELANIMADVRRGLWIPPQKRPRASRSSERAAGPRQPMPTFHEYASTLMERREGAVAEKTIEYERWGLSHLLPYFATWPLDTIDIEAVDDYRAFKVRQARARRTAIEQGRPMRVDPDDLRSRILLPLSNGSINKTLDVLQSVLASAAEYRHIPENENAAAGRRRRLRVTASRPVYLDSVDQIQAMLDAAQLLDRHPRTRVDNRLAAVATLMFAGPRAVEACLALWRDMDLANHRIEIGRSKTRAGLREIHYLPILGSILTTHKATSKRTGPGDLVFATSTGTERDKDNLRNRVVNPVVELADQLLIKRDQQPLPRGVTPHKLRHTFASILVACGEDPNSVMAQLGHTDPEFTLRVYTHMMRRSPEERARLRALVYSAFVPLPDDPA